MDKLFKTKRVERYCEINDISFVEIFDIEMRLIERRVTMNNGNAIEDVHMSTFYRQRWGRPENKYTPKKHPSRRD